MTTCHVPRDRGNEALTWTAWSSGGRQEDPSHRCGCPSGVCDKPQGLGNGRGRTASRPRHRAGGGNWAVGSRGSRGQPGAHSRSEQDQKTNGATVQVQSLTSGHAEVSWEGPQDFGRGGVRPEEAAERLISCPAALERGRTLLSRGRSKKAEAAASLLSWASEPTPWTTRLQHQRQGAGRSQGRTAVPTMPLQPRTSNPAGPRRGNTEPGGQQTSRPNHQLSGGGHQGKCPHSTPVAPCGNTAKRPKPPPVAVMDFDWTLCGNRAR